MFKIHMPWIQCGGKYRQEGFVIQDHKFVSLKKKICGVYIKNKIYLKVQYSYYHEMNICVI